MVDINLADQYREAGRACERVSDNSGARRYYQMAILQNPQDYNALANLAWVEHKEGNTNVAKGLIKKACEARPDKERFRDLSARIEKGIKRLDL